MAKKYDLIVVGGGTSGLEAAKTASESGLRVALLEMKTNPAKNIVQPDNLFPKREMGEGVN